MKGVIFDVDGTLLDSMGIWETAGIRYLKRYHIEAPEDLGRTLFAMTVEEAAGYLKQEYGLAGEIQEIIDGILDTVKEYYETEAPLKRGARSLLETLQAKGIPMAVATSSEKCHIEAAFTRLGIRPYFQRIVTCTEAGAGKQEPVVYHRAAECFSAEPEEIWVVEDALYAARTAAAAGYRTVGVYDVSSEADQEALKSFVDIYVTELTELADRWSEVGRNM